MRYFAYGANMACAPMQAHCPGHRFLGVARLEGYRLAFTRRSIRSGTGVADAVADPGGGMWGVLYELAPGDIDRLDRKEGRGFAYERHEAAVYCAERERLYEAFVYRVMSKEPSEVRPSWDYVSAIVAGARERSLPEDYVRSLEELRGRWGLDSVVCHRSRELPELEKPLCPAPSPVDSGQ